MPFEYFSDFTESPNEMYRNLMQAFIDEHWDNTSNKTPENGGQILEQTDIGSTEYKCIEAWVKATIAETTTGIKSTEDFMKLIFRDINHETKRGLYYKFNDNYWIVTSYNHFNGLPQDVGIRRCNNHLRMIDPSNGSVFSIPCVVGYDMMSPALQVGRYINTPNSHAEVIVQGNADTLRLFTLNTRFMLGGRPFKLYSMQDLLDYSEATQTPTYITLDLYLDELHAQDDVTNMIAYNGDFNYAIAIDADDMSLPNGSTGKLKAGVTLNGVTVAHDVVWSTSDKTVVTIAQDGTYSVVGAVGKTATIKATIDGNESVYDSIVITVASSQDVDPTIVVAPKFSKIRQYQTLTFTLSAEYGGATYSNVTTTVTCSDTMHIQLTSLGGNKYSVAGLLPYNGTITLNLTATNASPQFTANDTLSIKCVSMMG